MEAQQDVNPGYPLTKRALYYCSRMISAQYGREFEKSEYGKLKKVYSIWICTDGPLYKQNTINIYSVKEDSLIGGHVEPVSNYDVLTVVMIYTAKDIVVLEDDVIKMLSVLLSRNLGAQERMNILENNFHIAMTEKVKQEVDEMCNLSQGVREEERNKIILNMLTKKKTLSDILDITEASKDDVMALAKANGLEVVMA